VFVQYLFALSVVEACRDESVLGSRGKHIRLKWPNDLYAVVGPKEEERKKIGGILVNTSFTGRKVDIVIGKYPYGAISPTSISLTAPIGCGLNVLNEAPIFSLAQLLPPGERSRLGIERTVTAIISTFEGMWNDFVRAHGSFDSFMSLYLERWLHSFVIILAFRLLPNPFISQ
jgi:biotin--protein ligase